MNQLYTKYRAIAGKRQSSNSDLPIDNSSLKKTLATNEKEQKQPEKKAYKKLTVGFVDQLKVNTEGEDNTDEENEKKKNRKVKKKTTKSKKDASVDSSEQEEPDQIRTRRTTSKKEK